MSPAARRLHSLVATLAILPSMSLIPSAPLYLGSSRCARPLPCGVTGHVARPARSILPSYFLIFTFGALVPRPRCPGSDTERSEHDFHCQRTKDESHYTDEHRRALPTDHPQNRIRKN